MLIFFACFIVAAYLSVRDVCGHSSVRSFLRRTRRREPKPPSEADETLPDSSEAFESDDEEDANSRSASQADEQLVRSEVSKSDEHHLVRSEVSKSGDDMAKQTVAVAFEVDLDDAVEDYESLSIRESTMSNTRDSDNPMHAPLDEILSVTVEDSDECLSVRESTLSIRDSDNPMHAPRDLGGL